MRLPATFTSPDLIGIHNSIPIRSLVHGLLILGYVLAILSLILSRKPTLGLQGFSYVLSMR